MVDRKPWPPNLFNGIPVRFANTREPRLNLTRYRESISEYATEKVPLTGISSCKAVSAIAVFRSGPK
jgi:hypothetical protein